MGLFGKIVGKALALPIRIVNAPLDVTERLIHKAIGEEMREEDRLLSAIGKIAGDAVEDAGTKAGDSIAGE